MLTRRHFLKGGSAAALTLALTPAVAAVGGLASASRLIFVILRGGLDGLAAVPPYGDNHYRRSRGDLALAEKDILDLDGFFGLNPGLPGLHQMYAAKELVVLHNIAPPYRGRSHFDAQNILESGATLPFAEKTGWLYRSLGQIGAPEQTAMAIGPSVPLLLRGNQPVGSWAPDRLPDPDDDTMARLLRLYEADQVLGPAVETMLKTEDMLDELGNLRRTRGDPLQQLAGATARFLSHDDGPRIAVLESSGWDTHANQGSSSGPLKNRLSALDKVLTSFKTNLGRHWKHTAVVVVTEFGRTVAANGTRGTDHGVGGAAFLLGGRVAGGQVIHDWQGLARNKLFEGRDLTPGIDQRQLFKALLSDHVGMDANFVDSVVFPGSRDAPPLRRLFT